MRCKRAPSCSFVRGTCTGLAELSVFQWHGCVAIEGHSLVCQQSAHRFLRWTNVSVLGFMRTALGAAYLPSQKALLSLPLPSRS